MLLCIYNLLFWYGLGSLHIIMAEDYSSAYTLLMNMMQESFYNGENIKRGSFFVKSYKNRYGLMLPPISAVLIPFSDTIPSFKPVCITVPWMRKCSNPRIDYASRSGRSARTDPRIWQHSFPLSPHRACQSELHQPSRWRAPSESGRGYNRMCLQDSPF